MAIVNSEVEQEAEQQLRRRGQSPISQQHEPVQIYFWLHPPDRDAGGLSHTYYQGRRKGKGKKVEKKKI